VAGFLRTFGKFLGMSTWPLMSPAYQHPDSVLVFLSAGSQKQAATFAMYLPQVVSRLALGQAGTGFGETI
jgi:hypothetical protein